MMFDSVKISTSLFSFNISPFSFQRAEAAQREAESLREQLSLSNQSQQLSSPAKADPDTVTHFSDSLDGWQRGIDRLKISLTF